MGLREGIPYPSAHFAIPRIKKCHDYEQALIHINRVAKNGLELKRAFINFAQT